MTLKTESEARQCWCPFARAQGDGANRTFFPDEDASKDGEVLSGMTCLASGCMAWRWDPRDDERGYCGLVGTPD